MSETPSFWYVEATLGVGGHVSLAVAAFTERSARIQARKRLGKTVTIDRVGLVEYAHAWVISHRDPEGV